ncbi:MAG: [Fe-S]-binding protein, partial [Desulfobacterota bacterium]|nr:[Fe-S]-binding protein [Thermodesulfobacteriota bacterium]
MDRSDETDPWIRSLWVRTPPPSLKDNTADVERLIKGIGKELGGGEVRVDLPLSRRIPSFLRDQGYQAQTVLYLGVSNWHLVDLFSPAAAKDVCGLAVDLGTSVIAIRLLDLATGDVKGETSFLNPQIQAGPDILTRIHFAGREGGLQELQTLLMDRLNKEIHRLAQSRGISIQR